MMQKRDTSAIVVGWIVVGILALSLIGIIWLGLAKGEYWNTLAWAIAGAFALMLWLGFTLSSSRRPSR